MTSAFLGPELAKLSPAAIWRSRFPESLESDPGDSRVVHSVLGVAVAEVILDEPEVVALVRQVEATGVPQRVRVNPFEASSLGGSKIRSRS